MSTIPQLMVLYSNDAVEVRYADQSCLQVAPCGSTFVHHESPGETFHPAHGMKSVHKRSQFVTSDYKYKVIQALDFRNRFAERPFISKDLVTEDQIVHLYATVQDVAWPKSIEDSNYEFLPDGGVRLISVDEYASVVLSPHRQDFTVCYLSKISEDKKKVKLSSCLKEKSDMRKEKDEKLSVESKIERKINFGGEVQGREVDCHTVNGGNSELSKGEKKYNDKTKSKDGKHVEGASPRSEELPSPRSLDHLSQQLHEELNMSPISVVSGMRSCHSSPGEKVGQTEYNRYSTPTGCHSNQEAVKSNADDFIDIGGKRSAFKYYERKMTNDQDGSFLETLDVENKSKEGKLPSVDSTLVGNEKQIVSREKFSSGNISNYVERHSKSASICNPTLHEGSDSGDSINTEVDEDGRCRQLYTWITKHFSCDECPVAWSHPVNIARTLMDKREELEEKALKQPFIPKKSNLTVRIPVKERDKLCISVLPMPLPLSCPSQHLHKQLTKYIYDQDKDPLENLTTFKQGKLKVLMVEGIIFRIIRLTSTKCIEIFPGDGSVILSQGIKGHYYRHIIPVSDTGEVDERTYSVKSLPPTPPGAPYSLEKLVKRANRFVIQANQEDKMITGSDVCCWKHQSAIVEPLSTHLLEECTVPGYGRFSAFSSGHVRILFEGRTSLDMDCDFSKRIEDCLQHSDETGHMLCRDQMTPGAMKVNAESRLGFCKLLLPNGQYQIVDVRKPGLYRKYTDSALEWAAWVNSSPSKRKDFYREREKQVTHEQLISKELQKIQCFNYIVDHSIPTVSTHSSESKTNSSPRDAYNSYSSSSGHMGITDRASDQASITKPSVPVYHSYTTNSDSHLPHSYQSGTPHIDYSHLSREQSNSFRTESNSHPSSDFSNTNSMRADQFSNLEMLQGFHSVRQALLRTSKVINDIDDILDKRKS